MCFHDKQHYCPNGVCRSTKVNSIPELNVYIRCTFGYLVHHVNMFSITKHATSESLLQFPISEIALSLFPFLPFFFLITAEPLSNRIDHKKRSPLFFFDYLSLSNTIYSAVKTSQSCFVWLLPSSKAALAYLYLQLHQPPDETHTGPSADKVSPATRYIHHSPT